MQFFVSLSVPFAASCHKMCKLHYLFPSRAAVCVTFWFYFLTMRFGAVDANEQITVSAESPDSGVGMNNAHLQFPQFSTYSPLPPNTKLNPKTPECKRRHKKSPLVVAPGLEIWRQLCAGGGNNKPTAKNKDGRYLCQHRFRGNVILSTEYCACACARACSY